MDLSMADVPAYSVGCAALGSGGGGDVRVGALLLARALADRGPLPVTAPEDLGDAPVVVVGAVGSPTVMLERLPSTGDLARAVEALTSHLGRAPRAVAPLEIGGVNGLLAAAAAAWLGVPLLDADAMGRAYPRLDQTTLGPSVPAQPLALAGATGGVVLVEGLPEAALGPAIGGLLPALGGWAATALHPCAATDLARHAVRGSVRRALDVGRHLGGEPGTGPASVDRDSTPKTLAAGQVLEVLRDPGHPTGGVITLAVQQPRRGTLRLDLADELLAATLDGRLVAAVPDVLVVRDLRTGAVLLGDAVRVGQRLEVLTLPAAPELRAAGDRLGPAGLGLAVAVPA